MGLKKSFTMPKIMCGFGWSLFLSLFICFPECINTQSLWHLGGVGEKGDGNSVRNRNVTWTMSVTEKSRSLLLSIEATVPQRCKTRSLYFHFCHFSDQNVPSEQERGRQSWNPLTNSPGLILSPRAEPLHRRWDRNASLTPEIDGKTCWVITVKSIWNSYSLFSYVLRYQ